MPFWPFKRKTVPNAALNWVTSHLAVGHAPMSYDQLDRLKAAGIDCILNLCAEFPDLPRIEKEAGFEVYYLPVEDEETPAMLDMDQALAWIDESIYLGRKVLIHCRHGIGRTGTLVSAYLMRRGLSSRLVSRKLKSLRSRPASYCQWRLLRKYGKEQGQLTLREPSLEYKNVVDLSPFMADLESIFCQLDQELAALDTICGQHHTRCCRNNVKVSLIEAVALTHKLNTRLDREQRQNCISRAADVWQARKAFSQGVVTMEENLLCPLSHEQQCLLFDHRPLACRLHDTVHLTNTARQELTGSLRVLSENLFLAFSGQFMPPKLVFDLNQVISGKYVQAFFYALKGSPSSTPLF